MARSSRHLARPSPRSRRSPSPCTTAALASDDPAPPSPQPQPRTVGRAGALTGRGEPSRGRQPHQGRGARSAFFRWLCPSPQPTIKKKPRTHPQNLQRAPFGTKTARLPPPPPSEIWGRGAPSSGLSPARVAGQLCG